jgi:hypothetical protein
MFINVRDPVGRQALETSLVDVLAGQQVLENDDAI